MSETDLNTDRAQLLDLIKSQALFREKITLSSGKESDYYIDARRVTLSAKGAYLSARLILDEVKNDTYDAIGGPTLGADPLVGAIAALSEQIGSPVSTFIIRKNAKAHGRQLQIEGPELKEDAQVILVDDVATTGKAFIQSLDVIEKMNIKAVKAVCLVDRGEGAADAVAQRGCQLISLYDIKEVLS